MLDQGLAAPVFMLDKLTLGVELEDALVLAGQGVGPVGVVDQGIEKDGSLGGGEGYNVVSGKPLSQLVRRMPRGYFFKKKSKLA